MLKLLRCVREYKKATVLTFIFILIEAVMETIIPFVTASMLNGVQQGTDMRFILSRGGLLIVLALCSLCAGAIAGKTSAEASAGFAKNMRSDIFASIQRFSFANIDRFSSSSLVTRLTTDVSNAQLAYMMTIRTAVRAPLMLIFSIIMAFIMGGALATSFVIIIPVLVFGLLMIARKAMPAFRSVFRKYDRLNESIEENVRGMRVVKGFSREDHEKKKFGAAADDIRGDFTRAERIVALNAPLMQLCIYFNMVFILLVGSRMILSSGGAAINVGEISAMLNYGFQIMMQLMMLSMIYVILTISYESMERIGEVLDGEIDFDAVSFRYSEKAERDALSDIELHIPSGSTVGVLGGTGSGKSSLVQLIPRLYDVSAGAVRVGGEDVRSYELDSLRRSVAMVLQKNMLFSGTIAENLRWGNENATDEELVEACRLAQAHEFIESFPDGYNTHIEQGGTNVSGGQKQRICIARALLGKPKILILDDSTSAVDTKTDALIRDGFARFIPETTKIIISQRVSSVMDADMIIVLDGGRIVASGKHEQLLETSDIYRELYEQQTGGDGDEE